MTQNGYGKCIGIKLKTDKKVRPVSSNMVEEMRYRESLNDRLHNWLIIRLRTGHELELSPDLVEAIKKSKPADEAA